MAELLCLTRLTIVYRYLSETMSAPTYDKCHYFVVKALGLADDEEKKFNHRRIKYYYVRNPNVGKGDYFDNFTLNRTVWENEK